MAKFGIPVCFATSDKLGAELIQQFLLASAEEIDTR